jgi:uncharacterized membrane protein
MPNKEPRVAAIDVLRGAVVVLMAIDHVRVYSGLPAGGPTAGIFFTRWITHFVAPAFAFLAGTSAFLLGRTLGDWRALSRFLVSRGLLLVVLEVTLIRFTWTFNLAYDRWLLAGVIWMLGWCMVLLALLVRLRPSTVGWIGLGIMIGQPLFGLVPRVLPDAARPAVGRIWEFVYPAGLDGPSGITILYVLVPWIGVMAAGYGFGTILLREESERRRRCLRIGLAATALYLVVGSILALRAAPHDGMPNFFFRLLNQNKYPASALFLLMTLGPMIALYPLVEQAKARWIGVLRTFGRVPMLYYLLHIPLIHLLAIGVMRWRGAFDPAWYDTAPYTSVPPEGQWSLPLLYLVFVVAIALLYPLCAWYARVKASAPKVWMRYI